MVGAWARVAVGFAAAAAVGVIAALAGGSPLAVAGAAGAAGAVSGVFGAFVPLWVDAGNQRVRRREDFRSLSGPKPMLSLANLLRADREVVPFTGREQAMSELLAWCQDPDAVPLQLLVGAGGVGKTRLAEALMSRLREVGWSCTAVAADLEAEAWSAARTATARPVLLVVDYAETRSELLKLLRSVAAEEDRLRVRVLLLARGAGEWWKNLEARDAPIRALIQAAGPIEVTADLGAGLSDREVAASAVPHFARALGVEPPDAGSVAVPQATDGQVPVLVLHATALLAVLEAGDSGAGLMLAPAGGRLAASDVLRSLLGHEGRLWLGSRPASLATMTAAGCRAVVALGCLLSPPDLESAAKALERVPELSGVGMCRAAARWLRELYPPHGERWWGSLAPDLLAEHLVCEALANDLDLVERFLGGLDTGAASEALTVLVRAAAHHSAAQALLERALRADLADMLEPALEVAVRTGGMLGTVLARVISDAPMSWDALVKVAERIPFPSVALAGADLAVAQRLLEQIPLDTAPAVRAGWLSNLSVKSYQAGRPVEALPPAQQAVDIYRRLAENDPDGHLGDLAASLNGLAMRYADLGRPVDALPPMQEAADVYRRLAENDPDSHLGDLGLTLTNLGIRLSQLGRSEEALPLVQEAVAIRRRLAQDDREQHLADLAHSLNSLGVRLSELGRPTQALAPMREATDIRRRLAEANPDRHQDDLAMSATNLSVFLTRVGRSNEALAFAREGVAIRRRLTEVNPDRYLASLTLSLQSLSSGLANLGRPEEALAPVQEAVRIRRGLAQANPDFRLVGLAYSLVSLGARLAELERYAEALPPTREAVDIRRPLVQADSDRRTPGLANALTNLGKRLAELHRPADALPPTQEAVDLCRRLVQADSDRRTPGLANALTNLGKRLAELHRPADALPPAQEAADLYRRLVQADPDSRAPALANALASLGRRFAELDRPADALPPTREAADLYRRLARTNPGRYLSEFRLSLLDVGKLLARLGRDAEAASVLAEAGSIPDPPGADHGLGRA